MSGKGKSSKNQRKEVSKTTPRSVVQKTTLETGKFLQQHPESSPDVSINTKPADRCFQQNPKSPSLNFAVNAKTANRYDTKAAPIIAYVHSVSPPKETGAILSTMQQSAYKPPMK